MNGVRPIAIDSAGQAKAIDSLRTLLDRLGSPEVTLPEAQFLRSQDRSDHGEISTDQERFQAYS